MFDELEDGFTKENIRNALKISIVYITVGMLWIFFSDKIIHSIWAEDTHAFYTIEIFKGWFFVITTGILLFFLILKLYKRIFQLKKKHLGERNLWLSGFEKINDSVFILDENLNILMTNKPALKQYGYSQEEIKKLRLRDIRSVSESMNLEEFFKKIKVNKSLNYKTTHRKKSGEEFPVSVITNKVVQFGKIYYIHVSWDISNQIEQEILIRRNQELLKKTNETLHNLLKNFQQKVEDEKKIMSREIHDQLGQELTAIKMDVSILKKDVMEVKDEQLRSGMLKEINSINMLIDRAVNSVRQLATKLRPGVLDKLGLPDAIRWLANDYESRSNLKFDINIVPEDIYLDDEKTTNIFRIFQEALTNIARHSKAENVNLNLIKNGFVLIIEIRDDGIGIPKEKLQNRRSIGLYAIEERVNSMGGLFELISAPGKGTTIKISIPA